jgi:hypothetical protein
LPKSLILSSAEKEIICKYSKDSYFGEAQGRNTPGFYRFGIFGSD